MRKLFILILSLVSFNVSAVDFSQPAVPSTDYASYDTWRITSEFFSRLIAFETGLPQPIPDVEEVYVTGEGWGIDDFRDMVSSMAGVNTVYVYVQLPDLIQLVSAPGDPKEIAKDKLICGLKGLQGDATCKQGKEKEFERRASVCINTETSTYINGSVGANGGPVHFDAEATAEMNKTVKSTCDQQMKAIIASGYRWCDLQKVKDDAQCAIDALEAE